MNSENKKVDKEKKLNEEIKYIENLLKAGKENSLKASKNKELEKKIKDFSNY